MQQTKNNVSLHFNVCHPQHKEYRNLIINKKNTNMKAKRIALTVIMMLAVVCANAQYEPGKWSMQVKYGFGASQLTSLDNIPLEDVASDSKMRWAYSIGLDFEYQISKMFSMSAGIHRNSQGSAWDDFTKGGEKYKDAEIDLDYYTLPVLGHFYVYKGLALNAGVQLGYLIDADISMNNTSNIYNHDLTTKKSYDVEDDCKDLDISIPVGISYEFNSHVVLGAQYNIGLTKVNKTGIFGTKDIKNGVFQFSVAIKSDL